MIPVSAVPPAVATALARAADVLPLLTQATAAGPERPAYRYARPFLQPMPVWDHWPWLIIPLAVAVAVVYKSIKCRRMNQVPKEAAVLTLWILAGMGIAAGVLAVLVNLVARAKA